MNEMSPTGGLARAVDGTVRLACVGMTGTAVLGAILLGGLGVMPFIDIPSIILVALPTICLTVACFGVRAPAESVGFLFAGDPTQDQLSRGTGIAFSLGGFALGSGMVGSIIGTVQMLQNMSDPTAIGPALAVALLTTFYGLCVALAAFACGLRLAALSGRGDVVGAAGSLSSGALAFAGLALYGPTMAACGGGLFLAMLLFA